VKLPLNILLVDDELDVEFIFHVQFKNWVRKGLVNISFCDNADTALQKIRNKEESFDLVLSDINMPGKDGIKLLDELKKEFEGIAVYIISAYDRKDYITMAKELGADYYITKPIDFEHLKNRIKEVYLINT
jgi:YesN/AraC family two-component response regulator